MKDVFTIHQADNGQDIRFVEDEWWRGKEVVNLQ